MNSNLTPLKLNVSIKSGNIEEIEAGALVLAVYDDLVLTDQEGELDSKVKGKISFLLGTGDFKGKAGEIGLLYSEGLIASKRIMLLGLGSKKECNIKTIRDCSAALINKLNELNISSAVTYLIGYSSGTGLVEAREMTEISLLTAYQYKGQKSDFKNENTLTELFICGGGFGVAEEISRGIFSGTAYAEGVYLARDLINLPPNICNPSFMAEAAAEMAGETGLSVHILHQEELEKEKMGAYLAMARGSENEPEMIVLEHNKERSSELDTLVLVGKGVTFDAGGYSLKTTTGIVGMKGDMGGAGAVLGAMRTIARLDLPFHVVGITPCAENKISGGAYLPDEVVTASNGKTIEIVSTDAEGRLLLCDAMVYAAKYEPAAVVDIATLTGSSYAALAGQMASIFANDEKVAGHLQQAADNVDESVWRMPLDDVYFEVLKSNTADMKNSARGGGISSAPMFLKQFAAYPWIHIDIAGMESEGRKISYSKKGGASGFGVRLLTRFVADWEQ